MTNQKVIEIDSTEPDAHIGLAELLLRKSRIDEKNKKDYIDTALLRIDDALRLNSKYAAALNSKAYILLEIAKIVDEKMRDSVLSDAHRMLISANENQEGIADYNLACYYSLIEDEINRLRKLRQFC